MLRVIRLYLAKKFHRDYKRGLRFTLEILRSYCEFSTHLQRFCFFFLCALSSPHPKSLCLHLGGASGARLFSKPPLWATIYSKVKSCCSVPSYSWNQGLSGRYTGTLSTLAFGHERGSQVTEILKAPYNCSALS